MAPIKAKKKNKKKYELVLSKQDLALKEELELYVENVQSSDAGLQKAALESLRREIRYATSSMTVPKPLLFLHPHYGTLQSYYEKMKDSDSKKLLADILSVLAWTMSLGEGSASLDYRLLSSNGDISSWGHEYVRNLAREISEDIQKNGVRYDDDDFCDLVRQIVIFYMKHNAEPEAVDLALEFGDCDLIKDNMDAASYQRTCLYLTSLSKYHGDPSDYTLVLDFACVMYIMFEDYTRALRAALCMDNMQRVEEVFSNCRDLQQKQQLCFVLARHGVDLVLDENMDHYNEIICSTKLNEAYLNLAREIGVVEPILPSDVFKVHQLAVSGGSSLTPPWLFLATTFVNAFVNAGFGQDKLMSVPVEVSNGSSSKSWLSQSINHVNTTGPSTTASLGLILLWHVDAGRAELEKYIHSTVTHNVAGALLGVGIVSCNVKHQRDSAMSLLEKYTANDKVSLVRICAIMGLGLAHVGSRDDEIEGRMMCILKDKTSSLDVIAFATISLGLAFMGSCDEEVTEAIINSWKDRSASEMGEPLIRFLPLGLGLVYLGKQDKVDAVEVPETFNDEIKNYCELILRSCAYAGTGNVLQIQHFLGQCAKHNNEGGTYQGPAVLGIAMVAMAEELGLDMAIRPLEHLLKYGEQDIRRAVPLALGLLCISNPKVHVLEILGRLSRDADMEVAMAGIISLGLVGAGTNNRRIAVMLRNLLIYYHNENGSLVFTVLISQGLLHMGKGLLTLSPYHSERFLLSTTALAGLVIFLHACLDMKAIILGRYHFVLYFLALAMQPRMLMTLDEDLKPLSVPVRVGRAVDAAGKPGRPKTITGFCTHSTPVLLSAGQRIELATEKYIPLSPFLEGLVILKKNPEYKGNH